MLDETLERVRQRRRRESWRRRAELDIDSSASVGKIQLSGWGRPGSITIGARSVIEDGVVIRVNDGGRLFIGEDVEIRAGVVLNVSGQLELRGKNLLSWYTVVHCTQSVIYEPLAGGGELVTVIDSNHFHGETGASDEHWYHNATSSPVVIGRNTWLGAKSTITSGTTLGDAVTVAANAVVLPGSYNDRVVLAGVPAKVINSR